MADYSTPFADSNNDKRFPTATEIANGYGCGPLDKKLFDMLMHQLHAELGEVISFGGVTHTNDRNTLVREAIQAMLTPFLQSVNSKATSGTIQANGSRQFILKMSDNTQWILQLPAAENTFLTSINNDSNGGIVNADASRRYAFKMNGGPTWNLQLPTEPTIKSINGDTNGGTVNVDSLRRFSIATNGGPTWTLQLPAETPQEPQKPAFVYLTNPVDILNRAQTKASGNFDTGTVNLNLNSLSGVTVPSGATGVILQTCCGVSGNQSRIGESNSATFGYSWIQAGGVPSSATFTHVGQASNLVNYVDTNLGGGDNDCTNYANVRISGTTLAYRGRIYWGSNFTGVDTGYCIIRLVGFTL